MAQISHKITEFPGSADTPEPVASLPVDFLNQDRDPTREIRNMIDELQTAAREARRRQRQAEEECGQLRDKLRDMQDRHDSGPGQNLQIKALTRERDMLLEQQAQYGPAITDLKHRLKDAETEAREAAGERDAATRERKQAKRQLEEAEVRHADAFRQRDAALRQRELFKDERDKAIERETQAKKNFADAQKAIAESQKALAEMRRQIAASRKKEDGELAAQLDALRQARDGMSAQIKQLTQRVGELEDELAEANYAREAAEKLAKESRALGADAKIAPENPASAADTRGAEQLEAAMIELRVRLSEAEERNIALSESESRLAADLAALRDEMQSAISGGADNSALLEDARTSLVAAQRQIEELIRDRDELREQISANSVTLDAHLDEQTAEIAALRRTVGDYEARLAAQNDLQSQFDRRRLDMIELNTKLENAHREIRNLSASLAEARLRAKSNARPAPAARVPAKRDAAAHEAPQTRDEITELRRSFLAFSREPENAGILGELETLALQLTERATHDGHAILHRVCTAFASLLGDLVEIPAQVNESVIRTLNQTIEFIALLLADPDIENTIRPDEARVFVVDDDEDGCMTAVAALNLVGIRASHATSSSAAIAELVSNRYDLLILDVHLRDLNGFELSEQIRNMDLHSETPIFFVTGDTSLDSRVNSSLRGCHEFIAKPFSVQELALKALKSVITGQLRNR